MSLTSALVLGIESSCDETAAAVVRGGRVVLASRVASQTLVHAPFGGVVPEVASREHLKVIDRLTRDTLDEAGVNIGAVDAVAVTQGPGLIGALLVGIAYAKGLAAATARPLIPVDHVHAHVHGALLGTKDEIKWPTLALVVSGGHTNLYRMIGPTAFSLIGYSVDDACGESFDKVAKMLGLGYPGGPEIEKRALAGDPRAFAMPRMVLEKRRLEFSYAGLKTHVASLLRRLGTLEAQQIADLCASFQEEALGQIVRKLGEAMRRFPDTRSLLVAGGVAANRRFRDLASAIDVPSYFPELKYCADNAAMVAALGTWQWRGDATLSASFEDYGWDAYSRYDYDRWSVEI